MEESNSYLAEIEELRNRLAEAEEALEAIRSGAVDALVVYGDNGEKVYTLQGADETYRVMVEAINEGAATLSEDGIVTWANACLAETLNLPLGMLLGSRVTASIAPGDQQAFGALLLKSRYEKCKIELDLQTQDGSTVPVLLSLSPIISPGQITICLVATDLSEQKRNIEIAAAERVAKTIIEQAAEAILVCDIDGTVVRASHSALRLAKDNPLFMPFDEVFPLVNEAESLDAPFAVQAVLAGQEFQGVEVCLQNPEDGATLSLQLSAKPLDIPGEGNLGCVITMTDITERKQTEQAIRMYAQQLERSNRDLRDFAFTASHDLQEPLRKIQSFGKILIESFHKNEFGESAEYIKRMQNAANRMEKMIHDLLTYSRVSTQDRPFEPVDLNLVMKNVLSDLENRTSTTGGQVQVGEMPVLEADPLLMHQLLQNLIANALKFHKPGEPPLVQVYSRHGNGEGKGSSRLKQPVVEVVVEDNGIGFNMEYIERIFQPFQRLHGRNEYEGSGIGLSICRRIAERHQGSITAVSEPGFGSTFIVTLPVVQTTRKGESFS